MPYTTQTEMIRAALERGERLTPLEALHLYGCFRLGARIWDLRKQGVPIVKDMVKRGEARVAEYRVERA